MYSLGVTLWAMLAGRNPPADGPDESLQLPAALAETINAMLTPDPRQRSTTTALVERVEALRRESPDWLKVLGGAALAGAAAAAIIAVVGGLFAAVFKRK